MSIEAANRLELIEEYFFSAKLREIKRLTDQGKPIINLGIGSPDLAPHPDVIEELQQSAAKNDAHGYQSYQGIPEFKNAVLKFYHQRFNSHLSGFQVLPLMGSKEGITHISLAYLNQGDQVLIPALGYPTYTSVTKMVGAEPVHFPLLVQENWKPDWDYLDALDTSKVKLMWLNYPHMPTGTAINPLELKRFVDYAQERDILIGFDNPYSFILNESPLSIFNVPGADQVALELNSLSKTFNMAGWRVGWVMGESSLIEPVLRIKSQMDSGMFKPVQLAASKALSLNDDWFLSIEKVYTQRRNLVYQILDHLNCEYSLSQSGMFVWAKVTSGSGEDMMDHLLEDFHVFIAPGFIFGEAGYNYVRLSLCASEELLREVLSRIQSVKN